MKHVIWTAMVAASIVAGVPAFADVKAGVEAWQRGDYRTAVNEWRGPAVAGDPDAQFNLGQAYKLGRGVPADLAQAEEWYRKAALQGHPQAEENYGLSLFENGKRLQAVEWLTKASARGEPRAQYVLGTMYFNGDAVEKDWVRAYALTARAAAQGLPQASTAQAQMDRYISLQDRQKGLELARAYERDAGRPQVAAVPPSRATQPPRALGRTDLPPSTAYQPSRAIPSEPAAEVAETRPAPPIVRPAPKPQPKPQPAQAAQAAATPVRDGGWRVQVGAFGDPANARRIGGQAGARFPGRQIFYVKAGRLTKVLVGPFASNAEASSACRAFDPCVPVRN
ncbi:sporulation protein [Sphingomonas suaedae]|uniref:Sporulation protein n=1 Tax=Sphingomonas suaedae TaxID=2599297 RepID=A0A518RBW4_9SPHN|nr:SPOR domain-containing protein [Sphingomonas suaedae]QDX24960.1 sporulation protein [Sphingomonas suaedae]